MKRLAIVLPSNVESDPSRIADISHAFESYRNALNSQPVRMHESVERNFRAQAAEIIGAALMKYATPERFGLNPKVFPELNGIQGIAIVSLGISNTGFTICVEYGLSQFSMFKIHASRDFQIEML